MCALLAVLLLAPATPAARAAGNIEGGNAFSELSQKAQEEPATTETTNGTATKEEARNNSKTLLIGIGVAVALLLAVAYVIVRDARRAAPVGAEDMFERRKGHDAAARRRKRRAKAKAAKAQRKRHR